MKPEQEKQEVSNQDIEAYLKAAVDALTPDIFDRLDLSVPQQKPKLGESLEMGPFLEGMKKNKIS